MQTKQSFSLLKAKQVNFSYGLLPLKPLLASSFNSLSNDAEVILSFFFIVVIIASGLIYWLSSELNVKKYLLSKANKNLNYLRTSSFFKRKGKFENLYWKWEFDVINLFPICPRCKKPMDVLSHSSHSNKAACGRCNEIYSIGINPKIIESQIQEDLSKDYERRLTRD